MKKSELKWNVFAHHIGEKEIEIYNIFEHGRFDESIKESLKTSKTKEEFKEKARGDLFYYFGSKCEWEIVLTSWPPHISKEKINELIEERKKHIEKYGNEPYSLYANLEVGNKVDVYTQVQLNFEIFIDYVWSFKRKSNRKEK